MRYFAIAIVLAVSAISLPAQPRRVQGPPRGRVEQPPEGVPISHKDIDRLTPARVILDRRAPLRLEPAQIAKLDSLGRAFGNSAKQLADSVKKYQKAVMTSPPNLKRPPEGKPVTKKDSVKRAQLDSTNRRERDKYFETVTGGRRDLAAALLALKNLYDASLGATIQALNGTQHTTAALALDQTSEEFTRRLRLANVR